MIEIRWHGRGGQGAFTASKILGAAALKEGKYALAFPSFGPERRGAPIQAFTKISEEPIIDRSTIKTCDYIIFLDETLFNTSVFKELKPRGKILLNTANKEKYSHYNEIITIDASYLAEEVLKMHVVNTVMLGAFAGSGQLISVQSIEAAIDSFLSPKIAAKNKVLVERASQLVRGKNDEATIK